MDKTTYFYPNRTLRLGDSLLDLSTPAVMGILNITPDSFFDGGRYTDIGKVLLQAEKLVNEGADIIDIGGMSTRPGATIIDPSLEFERVVPAIKAIREKFPHIPISIDTVHGIVAKGAIDFGACIINDVSGGSIDAGILDVAASTNVPYVLLHMQGTPDNMQTNPVYEDVVKEVAAFFINRSKALLQKGIHNIIIDPGFGFGKSLQHNYQLAADLDQLQFFGVPIMVGISRKSMICKLLHLHPEHALNGSTA